MPLPEHIDAPGDTFNFAQHLLTVNTQRPAKAAFIDDGGALTYGALDERVRRLGATLCWLGGFPTDRILREMRRLRATLRFNCALPAMNGGGVGRIGPR